MALIDTATKAFRALPNIGITQNIRPEEAKHIQYLNIGFYLMAVINLAYFVQGITDAKTPLIVPLAQISASILCILVFIFNNLRVHSFKGFVLNPRLDNTEVFWSLI